MDLSDSELACAVALWRHGPLTPAELLGFVGTRELSPLSLSKLLERAVQKGALVSEEVAPRRRRYRLAVDFEVLLENRMKKIAASLLGDPEAIRLAARLLTEAA